MMSLAWFAGVLVSSLLGCSRGQVVSTGDTARFDSEDGWGTCARLRSTRILGAPSTAEWVIGSAPHPEGGEVVSLEHIAAFDLEGTAIPAPGGPTGTVLAHLADNGALLSHRVVGEAGMRALHVFDDDSVLVTNRVTLDGDLAMLQRVAADGAIVWSQRWGGAWLGRRQVAVLADGTAVVVVSVSRSTTFDKGGPAELTVDPGDGVGLVLLAVGPDGAVRWVRSAGGTGTLRVADIVYDAAHDALVVGGTLGGTGVATFGAGQVVHDPSGDELFVARFDGEGSFRWLATSLGGSAITQGVGVLDDGGVVAGGDYTGLLRIRDSTGASSANVRAAPLAWLAAFDDEGIPRWVRTTQAVAGTGGAASTLAVRTTADGTALWVGTMTGEVAMGGPPDPSWTASPRGVRHFVGRVTADGQMSCGLSFEAGGALTVFHVAMRGPRDLQLGGLLTGGLRLGSPEAFVDLRARDDGVLATVSF